MIGYVLLAFGLGLGFGTRRKARRMASSRKPTWQVQIRFVDTAGASELVRIANEPRGYVFERSRSSDGTVARAGEILETRSAKGLEHAIDLAADIVSEQASETDPNVRIDLWRYDMNAYARRAALGPINTDGQGGRIIGQAAVTVAGGRGEQTRNYTADTITELVRTFVRSQLGLTWEEGYFA